MQVQQLSLIDNVHDVLWSFLQELVSLCGVALVALGIGGCVVLGEIVIFYYIVIHQGFAELGYIYDSLVIKRPQDCDFSCS